jgi:hypothetical protein
MEVAKLKTALVVLCFVLLTSTSAGARDHDFDRIVSSLESHYGQKRLYIPFFGIANFFVRTVRPAGARDIKLAIFEDLDRGHPSPEDLDRMFTSLPAQGWSPFVRVQSRHERVHIYSRRMKNDWELLITTLERDEAVVVRVRLNPDGLARWVNEPRFMARNKGPNNQR